MANMLMRAVRAIGRWTGFGRGQADRPDTSGQVTLVDPLDFEEPYNWSERQARAERRAALGEDESAPWAAETEPQAIADPYVRPVEAFDPLAPVDEALAIRAETAGEEPQDAAAEVAVAAVAEAQAPEAESTALSPAESAAPDQPARRETPTPWGDAISAALSADGVNPLDPEAVLARANTEGALATEPADPVARSGDEPAPEAAAESDSMLNMAFAAADLADQPVEAVLPTTTDGAFAEPAPEAHAQEAAAEAVPACEAVEVGATGAAAEAAEESESHRDAPRELKPAAEERPASEERPAAEQRPARRKPSITFAQLYDLISNEVGKRTDNAVSSYERLLATTREEMEFVRKELDVARREIESTRRNNRVAWAVGGAMTAVAAVGAVWWASEVSGAKAQLGALRQQVSDGLRVAAERDQLRADLFKSREQTAKVELDALRARLDQALAVSAERDRLRAELEAVRRGNTTAITVGGEEGRRAPATQPLSSAAPVRPAVSPSQPPVPVNALVADRTMVRPASPADVLPANASPAERAARADRAIAAAAQAAVEQMGDRAVPPGAGRAAAPGQGAHAVGSERRDVWSVLLNDGHE